MALADKIILGFMFGVMLIGVGALGVLAWTGRNLPMGRLWR